MAFFRGVPDINAGLDYSMYLSLKGAVYSWGDNSYRVLGNNLQEEWGNNSNNNPPTLVKYFREQKISIDRVVVGSRNWIAFFRSRATKDWYCSGFGGLMGLGRKYTSSGKSPIVPHVFFNERETEPPFKKVREVIEISPGGDFILFRVRDEKSGKVVVYEDGYKQRCTPKLDISGTFQVRLSQVLFFDDKQITKISCGDRHFFVVDTKGKIYCSGSNDEGQLGLGLGKDFVSIVLEHTYFPEKGIGIKTIKCTDRSSFFITTGGKVFACGHAERGELGINISEKFTSIPLEIVSFRGLYIDNLFCGRSTAFFLTNTGDVWRTGRDIEIRASELDEPPAQKDTLPRKVTICLSDKDEKIERMSVGQDQFFIMSSYGCVYGGGVLDLPPKSEESNHLKTHLLQSIARIDPVRSAGRYKRMLRQCSNYIDIVIRTYST